MNKKVKTDKVKKVSNDNQLAQTGQKPPARSNNFLMSILFAMLLLMAYKQFFEKPDKQIILKQQQEQQLKQEAEDKSLLQDPNSVFGNISNGEVVKIKTDKLSGEITLKGGRFNKLILNKYYTDVSKKENITLLKSGLNPYYIDMGWKSTDKTIDLPNENSVWSADNKILTTKTPIVMTYDNGKGLTFIREISIDENYMFGIKQSVKNITGKIIPITPYTNITKEPEKQNKDDKGRNYDIGAIGAVDGVIKTAKYKALDKKENIDFKTDDGWFGFSDKYWFVGSIFQDQNNIDVSHENINSHNVYNLSMEGAVESLQDEINYTSKIFAGPKELKLIDNYRKIYNIANFDKTIDFGWYYFLTKPFYYILQMIAGIVKNYGIAILIFTCLLRLFLYPLANKSYASMQKMKDLQPVIKEFKDKYGNDRQKMQMKTMELYKKEKVSPMGGCLPMLIQIPIFFSLYKVLSIAIELRQAPFFGWIQDLSMPDPTNMFTLFGLVDWNPPALLTIGVWPLLMGISMFFQQHLSPAPQQKEQAIVLKIMPVFFTFMLAHFASGLVIYWTFSNVLGILQQMHLYRKMGKVKN
jgi:YidC/Oxa1 family membrane protein insertase